MLNDNKLNIKKKIKNKQVQLRISHFNNSKCTIG